MTMRVGIIGAGITGLAATHFLRDSGIEVVTFEASDRVGGVIRSEEHNATVLEYGPQRLRLTPEIEELVDHYDLRELMRVVPDGLPLYIYRKGALHLVPRSPLALLRTNALSWRGKARLLAEPLTGSIRPDETAGDFLERKFGQECYEALVEPLLGGIYASNPRAMPASVAIQPLLRLEKQHGSLLRAAVSLLWKQTETPPAVSFDDGVDTLPNAIGVTHHDVIRLATPVRSIAPAAEGEGYQICTGSDEIFADQVLITVPASEAANMMSTIDDFDSTGLAELTYNPLAIVHLQSSVEVEGFGYQICREEAFETRGVTWNDSLFDRDGVFTAFLGGMDNPEICVMDPERIGEIARDEFSRILGGSPTVLDVTVLPEAIPAHDRSWLGISDLTTPPGIHLPTNYRGRIGVPGRIRAARQVADELRKQ